MEAYVDVVGSHASGAPAHGRRCLKFRGPPLLCNSGNQKAQTSPALAALSAPELEESRASLLKTELERIEELLEIEPDCKWALLSQNRLSTASAAGVSDTTRVEETCAEGYKQISALDPLRKGFYDEARAECLLRVRIMAWMTSKLLSDALELSKLALRHLPPCVTLATFGVRVLDVSNNDLRELGPLLLLLTLEELCASHNRLVGDVTEAFALPQLRRLDVSHNSMELRKTAVAPPPSSLREIDTSSNAAILALTGSVASEQPKEESQFSPPAREGSASQVLTRLLSGAPAADHSAWEVEYESASGKCICRSTASSGS